ncbi:MAG: oxidoreductase, partial [Gemmatimonadaceae bacterium]
MSTPQPSIDGTDLPLVARLDVAIELLEEIVADRALLAEVPVDERNRLLQAAGRVSRPDVIDRRRLLKVSKRKRKAERVRREEGVLENTGIRRLRRDPVFTSPNVFPPTAEEIQAREPVIREVNEPRNCYVCKQDYTAIHHFYDHLCPTCAEFNFAKRT